MITAELTYDGENVFRVQNIPDNYPVEYIRICQYVQGNQPDWTETENMVVEMKYTILVFKLDLDASHKRFCNRPENRYYRDMPSGMSEQKRIDTFLYRFSHTEQSRASHEVDSFDIGFAEPTKDVNLDFLTKRLKGKKKAQKVLQNYLKRR